MLNAEIHSLSAHFPEGFRRDFDAHVYYTTESRPQAATLLEKARADFRDKPVFVGRLIDRCVGPHPLPMFEMNFPKELLGEVLLWLLRERGGLTVLVHEVTGNDPRDHSEGAIWLGEPVVLDVSKLDPAPS